MYKLIILENDFSFFILHYNFCVDLILCLLFRSLFKYRGFSHVRHAGGHKQCVSSGKRNSFLCHVIQNGRRENLLKGKDSFLDISLCSLTWNFTKLAVREKHVVETERAEMQLKVALYDVFN